MNAVPFIVDYRDKLAEEIRSMPDEILPAFVPFFSASLKRMFRSLSPEALAAVI